MIRKLFLAVLLGAAGLAITLFLISQYHALFKDIKGLQGQQQTHHRARGRDTTARIYARPRVYRAATSTATTGGVPWLGVLWAGAGVLMLVVLPGVVVGRRLRARRSRRYAYYEIVHSMHDEAFTRDVEDGMEALAHAIRETPGRRLLHGQGHISWVMAKMLCDGEPDFKILLELEPRHAKTVDAVLASVWPDVRLGHGHTGDPAPHSQAGLIEPGRLLRYRKERPFYYALTPMAEARREFRAPLEAIGKMLTSTPGDYAIVRLQLTPMLQMLEGPARWRAHRAQNRVERGSLWGLADAGLKDTVRHEEFAQTAHQVVDRSLFSLEAQVAAPTLKDALRVGAALSASRGSNRLHRRVMVVREKLYKRRFTRAQGPLFPTLSGRSLVSSREIAHLVELPTARMKNVPLHRLPLPRVPMPPEVMRVERESPMDIERPAAHEATAPAGALPDVPPPSPDTAAEAPTRGRRARGGRGRLRRPAGRGPRRWRAMRRRTFFRRNVVADMEALAVTQPDQDDLATRHHARQPGWPMDPVLVAENGKGAIHPDDRKYGTLLVGTQGTGKTAAMLRLYGGDIFDPRAAVIIIDPKSELSLVALRNTYPECGKRVWYLDLARPAFGMNPLLRPGVGPIATEAAAIADGVVNSLMDLAQGQVFQSSRRYLYHAVIGALAFAEQQGRDPTMEDVHALLLPEADVARRAAVGACESAPDLDQTAAFFREELGSDLRLASAATAQRLDAPRNKVSLLTATPPLRRFFNHPTQVRIADIIANREILLVNANMGTLGTENAKACMLFVIHMLGAQMQRQMALEESERPRVALLIDEAHYVTASENLVDQIATHRAAGLDVTMGLQYFAQLGAGEFEEKIRSGIINLMQSRIIFRLGDTDDIEQSTRIAMAVYSTLIQSDVEARANMRITPEAVLNLPRYHALASWIVGGTRAASFLGRTLPIPDRGDEWADVHRARMAEVVGPYPESMAAVKGLLDERASDHPEQEAPEPEPEPPAAEPEPTAAAPEPEPPVEPEAPFPFANGPLPIPGREPPFEPLDWKVLMESGSPSVPAPEAPADASPAGAAPLAEPATPVAPTPSGGTPASGAAPGAPAPAASRDAGADAPEPEALAAHQAPGSLSRNPVRAVVGVEEDVEPFDMTRGTEDVEPVGLLRELVVYDALDRVRPDAMPRRAREPKRTSATNLAVLGLLDRCGRLPLPVIAAACLPPVSERSHQRRLQTMRDAGLVRRLSVMLVGRAGQAPKLYELTRTGFAYAQAHGAIHAERKFTAPDDARRGLAIPHGIHAGAYAIALHDALGKLMEDGWRTARLRSGRLAVPLVGSGRQRHPVTRGELGYPNNRGIMGIPDFFEAVFPDLSVELRIPRGEGSLLRFDVLVEYDRAQKGTANREKLTNYDALLGGWYRKVARYERLDTRPVALFVATSPQRLLRLVRDADQLMVGRYGIYGGRAEECYYPGRDCTFFALESDLHRGSLRVVGLHRYPPKVREALGDGSLRWRYTTLVPRQVLDAHR